MHAIVHKRKFSQYHQRDNLSHRNFLSFKIATSMVHDEGEDEETKGKYGSADGTKAICPFSFSFLNGQILEGINIVPEH